MGAELERGKVGGETRRETKGGGETEARYKMETGEIG